MSTNPRNHDYWYTDQDIHGLLRNNLQGRDVDIMAPIVLQNHNSANHQSLMTSNIGAILSLDEGRHAVMPVHLNSNHWAGIAVHKDRGRLIVDYIDPLGNPPPRDLERAFNEVGVDVRNLGRGDRPQQHNDYDCGVWTVENLTHLASHNGELPRAVDIDAQREAHRGTGLVGDRDERARIRQKIDTKKDDLDRARDSRERREKCFTDSFDECEKLQKAAIGKSIQRGTRGAPTSTHSNARAEELDSLAKLLSYKGPYIALAEAHDGNSVVASFPNQNPGELAAQRDKVRDLRRTLEYIRDDTHPSRRAIFQDALENGNIKAMDLVDRAMDAGGSIGNAAKNLDRDLKHRSPIDQKDLDIVFEYNERHGKVFFNDRDIANTQNLLRGKNMDQFIEVLDTTSPNKRFCHVELNAIEGATERAKSKGVEMREVNIGLATNMDQSVGCCGGCTIVLDALESKRGLSIKRTQDFPNNYPQAQYPYPKFLKPREQMEIADNMSTLLSNDRTSSRDFIDARRDYEVEKGRLDREYKGLQDKKKEIKDLKANIDQDKETADKLSSSSKDLRQKKTEHETHIADYSKAYGKAQEQERQRHARVRADEARRQSTLPTHSPPHSPKDDGDKRHKPGPASPSRPM